MKLDDPWGISWRTGNFIRRFDFQRTLTQTAAFIRGANYCRPIFILGVPRSGTTTLFHLLRESNQLAALATEGHNLWRFFHHPRFSGWRSDVVTQEQALPWERRFACAFIRANAAYHPDAERFVEKTPENSLRVSYLNALFPDAIFIVLNRNPGDVLNSIINGWRHPQGRFRSYFVPSQLTIPEYSWPHQWCFALIPGWRNLTSSTIPEVALAQWISISEHLIAGRKAIPHERWIELSFEELTAKPERHLKLLSNRLGLRQDAAIESAWREILETPRNSLSEPGLDKWRRENREAILPLLPRIKTLAAQFGYDIHGKGEALEIILRPRP